MLVVNPQPQFFHLDSKTIVPRKQCVEAFVPCQIPRGKHFSFNLGWNPHNHVYERSNSSFMRTSTRQLFAIQVVASGVEDTQVSSSQFQEFSVATCFTGKANELKLTVDVLGSRTQGIFDVVFSKMVADAHPIPGFRRIKGGKTPNIPNDILLEILGPSKVYKQVIKKVISTTISEYVQKEGLSVGKDLQVQQSFEDLEAAFEPGDHFRFEAILQLQDSN